jgi:hypothetical protein
MTEGSLDAATNASLDAMTEGSLDAATNASLDAATNASLDATLVGSLDAATGAPPAVTTGAPLAVTTDAPPAVTTDAPPAVTTGAPLADASPLTTRAGGVESGFENGAASPSPPRRAASRASERLRLAKVVFDAAFYADALRASYEAVASALGSLADGAPPANHQALVAVLYRDLLPNGKVPPAAHTTLARLHDLLSLDEHGVAIDQELARQAVEEAATWVERLAPNAGPA